MIIYQNRTDAEDGGKEKEERERKKKTTTKKTERESPFCWPAILPFGVFLFFSLSVAAARNSVALRSRPFETNRPTEKNDKIFGANPTDKTLERDREVGIVVARDFGKKSFFFYFLEMFFFFRFIFLDGRLVTTTRRPLARTLWNLFGRFFFLDLVSIFLLFLSLRNLKKNLSELLLLLKERRKEESRSLSLFGARPRQWRSLSTSCSPCFSSPPRFDFVLFVAAVVVVVVVVVVVDVVAGPPF